MKGIILAGGMGTRLLPLTKVTNKHLLPIGKLPMIVHLVEKLKEADIDDIMIITGTDHMGDMINLLGSGKDYGCKFTYRVQDEANGIAGALLLCEDFAGDAPIVVILGDNIFKEGLRKHIEKYEKSSKSCFLLLKKVPDPERYGVAILEDKKLVSATEKPQKFVSDLCITGIYMYDSSVFDKIRNLSPSKRGEYEIPEVNHAYIASNNADYAILNEWWTDAGTHESYAKANELINHNESWSY